MRFCLYFITLKHTSISIDFNTFFLHMPTPPIQFHRYLCSGLCMDDSVFSQTLGGGQRQVNEMLSLVKYRAAVLGNRAYHFVYLWSESHWLFSWHHSERDSVLKGISRIQSGRAIPPVQIHQLHWDPPIHHIHVLWGADWGLPLMLWSRRRVHVQLHQVAAVSIDWSLHRQQVLQHSMTQGISFLAECTLWNTPRMVLQMSINAYHRINWRVVYKHVRPNNCWNRELRCNHWCADNSCQDRLCSMFCAHCIGEHTEESCRNIVVDSYWHL